MTRVPGSTSSPATWNARNDGRVVRLSRSFVPLRIPGPALWAALLAGQLKRGVKVTNFGMGQNGFRPYPEAFEAVRAELATREARYSSYQGQPYFRETIARYYLTKHGLEYNPETQIVVVPGGKLAIDVTFNAILKPNDVVILSSPCWPYRPLVENQHAKAVNLFGTPEDNFKISPAQLEEAIVFQLSRKRHIGAFVFTNPSNPTGAVYTREEVRGLAAVLQKYQITVLEDHFYDGIIYDDRLRAEYRSIAEFIPELTMGVGGASKMLGMAGWRVAWVVGPKGTETGDVFANGMGRVKAVVANRIANTSNLDQRAAHAALEALMQDPSYFHSQVNEFADRSRIITTGLNDLKLTTAQPAGAFYVFANAGHYLGSSYKGPGRVRQRIENDYDLARFLISAEVQTDSGPESVSVIPGRFFELPGYVRLSYGCTDGAEIRHGLEVMSELLGRLQLA